MGLVYSAQQNQYYKAQIYWGHNKEALKEVYSQFALRPLYVRFVQYTLLLLFFLMYRLFRVH